MSDTEPEPEWHQQPVVSIEECGEAKTLADLSSIKADLDLSSIKADLDLVVRSCERVLLVT